MNTQEHTAKDKELLAKAHLRAFASLYLWVSPLLQAGLVRANHGVIALEPSIAARFSIAKWSNVPVLEAQRPEMAWLSCNPWRCVLIDKEQSRIALLATPEGSKNFSVLVPIDDPKKLDAFDEQEFMVVAGIDILDDGRIVTNGMNIRIPILTSASAKKTKLKP